MIPLQKSAAVQAALAEKIPVVALESTIITHGLPWPKNLETALLVEETVRAAGAVPVLTVRDTDRVRIGPLTSKMQRGVSEDAVQHKEKDRQPQYGSS